MHLFKFFKKNVKSYGHILSLGYNCEVAYQFCKHYHFVESSVFAWCNTINVDNLIFALNHFDKLLTGELKNPSPLWKCLNTNICFHGRAPMNIWMSENYPGEDVIKKDRNELLSRMHYLKTKFTSITKDSKKILYIFKYKISDNETKETVLSKINTLFLALQNFGKNQFDLLIVLDKDGYNLLENEEINEHIYLRSVNLFAPEDNVTGNINDKKGWKKIFKEFRPNFRIKKHKKFKFEEN